MAGLRQRRGFLLALPGLLAACAGPGIARRDGSSSARPFAVSSLAKGDLDNVAEIVQAELLASLKALAEKLYRRNPAEWRKTGLASVEAALDRLAGPLKRWETAPERARDWRADFADTWRGDFAGDRVGSLMRGLLAMQMTAFGHRTEFYLWHELDAQKLYNAARNLEAVAWALANRRDARGAPVLLSNAVEGDGAANLSFEREFGKLIALNDALARIVEDQTNRTIRAGVVNVAGFVLLPL